MIFADLILILEKAVLPELESLVIIFGDPVDYPELRTALTPVLVRHAPQLKSLVLSFAQSCYHCELPEAFWSALSSLEALTVDHDYTLSTVLSLLPALHRLRVRPSLRHFPSLTFLPLSTALRARPPCLGSLMEVLLPPAELPSWLADDPSALAELRSERAQVERLCAELRIEVVTVPRVEYRNVYEHLEDALELW